MEENLIGLEEAVDRELGLPEKDWVQYAPLTLAYLGDSVFDLVSRRMVLKRTRMPSGKMHQEVSRIVCAGSQARIGRAIRPLLTDEEEAVYRRGRGSKPDHNAKNASRRDYLEATALEALIGYLYLKCRYKRLAGLIREGLSLTGPCWSENDRAEESRAEKNQR